MKRGCIFIYKNISTLVVNSFGEMSRYTFLRRKNFSSLRQTKKYFLTKLVWKKTNQQLGITRLVTYMIGTFNKYTYYNTKFFFIVVFSENIIQYLPWSFNFWSEVRKDYLVFYSFFFGLISYIKFVICVVRDCTKLWNLDYIAIYSSILIYCYKRCMQYITFNLKW